MVLNTGIQTAKYSFAPDVPAQDHRFAVQIARNTRLTAEPTQVVRAFFTVVENRFE